MLRYGEDEHYDVISAFIKSIRGSDPDAGLYWLARMLEAGEDARYIARRLVILASEDVGMADSMGLVVADAAARAVEFVACRRPASTWPTPSSTWPPRPSRTPRWRAVPGVGRRAPAPAAGGAGPLRSVHPYQANKLGRAAATATPTTTRRASSPRSTGPRGWAARPGPPSAACTTGPRPTARRPTWPSACGRGGATPPTTREAWHEFEKFRDPER